MLKTGNGLTPSVVVMIVFTIAMLACGQVLFKLASSTLSFTRPASLVSWTLFLALSIYGLATLLWLAVLAKVPLSTAFPFYGLTFLLVPTLSFWLLKEPVRPQIWYGGVIIMVGVIVSSCHPR